RHAGAAELAVSVAAPVLPSVAAAAVRRAGADPTAPRVPGAAPQVPRRGTHALGCEGRGPGRGAGAALVAAEPWKSCARSPSAPKGCSPPESPARRPEWATSGLFPLAGERAV